MWQQQSLSGSDLDAASKCGALHFCIMAQDAMSLRYLVAATAAKRQVTPLSHATSCMSHNSNMTSNVCSGLSRKVPADACGSYPKFPAKHCAATQKLV
jgi:hypothetical protein